VHYQNRIHEWMSTNDLISVPEAAEIRGVSRQAVYQALDSGTLTERKAGTHRLVVVDDAFHEWVEKPPQPGISSDSDTSSS